MEHEIDKVEEDLRLWYQICKISIKEEPGSDGWHVDYMRKRLFMMGDDYLKILSLFIGDELERRKIPWYERQHR